MHMLRGGRGGEVRAKLFISLLWVAVAPPHAVTYPARTWAALLGLADPAGLGARRINDALAWLADEEFVKVEGSRGIPAVVTVLDESGNGRSYSVPGAKISQLTASGRGWNRHVYDKVPVELWTNGWLAAMSGPALGCFLVLLSTPGARESDDDQRASWFTRSLLSDRYDMSDDTRQRGMRDLRELGLVEVRQRVLARTSVDFQRSRNTYRLRLDRLRQPLLANPPSPSKTPRTRKRT